MSSLNLTDLPFVEELIHLNFIDSTNTYAKSLIRYPCEGLAIILADRQTAGRGQRGNSFFSSVNGGLWFTVVCPMDDLSSHFTFNRAMSTAVYDAVKAFAFDAPVAIKWPNDLCWGPRKFCGMLLETAATHLLIGAGVNVNLTLDQFPPDVRTIATSLSVETGRSWDQDGLLREVLTHFWKNLHDDPSLLHARYRAALYGIGRIAGIGAATGRYTDVLPDGRLCLDVDGRNEYFTSGPLRFADPGACA